MPRSDSYMDPILARDLRTSTPLRKPAKSAVDQVQEEITKRTNAYREAGQHVEYAVVLGEVMRDRPDLAAQYRDETTVFTTTGKPIGTRASFGVDQSGRNVTKSLDQQLAEVHTIAKSAGGSDAEAMALTFPNLETYNAWRASTR